MDKNNIVLRSVYGKVIDKYILAVSKNPVTGRYPDCVRRVNSMGDMILSDNDRNSGEIFIPENQIFEVKDGTTLNLEDPWEAAEWECIKYSPIIAMSRDARDSKGNLLIDGEDARGKTNARYGIAELYVEAPERESIKRISSKQLRHKAESYIFDDEKGATGRVFHARLLGKDMKSAPDSEVTEYLLDIASKDPQRIIDVYAGSDTGLRLLVIEAREKHIITIKNKVYVYADDIVLGITEDAVLAYLKDPKNKRILELIKRDTYPELEAAKADANKKEKKTTKE